MDISRSAQRIPHSQTVVSHFEYRQQIRPPQEINRCMTLWLAVSPALPEPLRFKWLVWCNPRQSTLPRPVPRGREAAWKCCFGKAELPTAFGKVFDVRRTSRFHDWAYLRMDAGRIFATVGRRQECEMEFSTCKRRSPTRRQRLRPLSSRLLLRRSRASRSRGLPLTQGDS